MSALREPVPFEVYEAGVYLHGTKADFAVGDVLIPGRESNFEAGRLMNYVYFTALSTLRSGAPSSPAVRAADASISSSQPGSSRTTRT